MEVWRISKKQHEVTAFTGEGGDHVSGRWSPVGRRVVYTSDSAAVAAMETFVHLNPSLMPTMVLICAELPIPEVEYYTPEDLPKNWKSIPAPVELQTLAVDWLDRCETAAFMVPSVPAPGGYNVLLNPAHPDMQRLKIISTEPFQFDKRMFDQD